MAAAAAGGSVAWRFRLSASCGSRSPSSATAAPRRPRRRHPAEAPTAAAAVLARWGWGWYCSRRTGCVAARQPTRAPSLPPASSLMHEWSRCCRLLRRIALRGREARGTFPIDPRPTRRGGRRLDASRDLFRHGCAVAPALSGRGPEMTKRRRTGVRCGRLRVRSGARRPGNRAAGASCRRRAPAAGRRTSGSMSGACCRAPPHTGAPGHAGPAGPGPGGRLCDQMAAEGRTAFGLAGSCKRAVPGPSRFGAPLRLRAPRQRTRPHDRRGAPTARARPAPGPSRAFARKHARNPP